VPNGGLRPGVTWQTDVDVAWTPTTALFALASAANADTADAEALLTWLDEHRTPLGALPEKVNESGDPASVAPLSWTGSLVLLALLELEDDLPIVPAP
jgi:GH15 family glucan-1,4-alpha-glucosidase